MFTDHTTENGKGSQPPHRRLYQRSPADQEAAQEYVKNLLKYEKIRWCKALYGVPLLFVRENDKLKGMVDNRVVNEHQKKQRL